MNVFWAHLLAVLALQHLWQSLLVLAVAQFAARAGSCFSARMKSRIWLCAFLLALILPFAVLLPRAAHVVPSSGKLVSISIGDMPAPSTPQSLPRSPPHQVKTELTLPTFDVWATHAEPVLISLWLLGTVGGLGRLLWRWRTARRLCRTSSPLNDLVPHELLRGMRVRTSGDISSPMVVGAIRPCIILPQALIGDASSATLRHVIDHEIAHVRRGDLWIAWLQAIGLAAYWWNPLLHLIGTRLDMTREMACDEQAIKQSGTPISYANALLETTRSALFRKAHPDVFAAGIFATRSALSRRVDALLDVGISKSIDSGKLIVLVSLGMMFVSISCTLLATPRLGYVGPTASWLSTHRHGPSLIAAVAENRPRLVRALILHGADVNARQTGDGTALIVAAKRGDADMVRELIGLGADVNKVSPGEGSALIVAARLGDTIEVGELIDAGANVNARSKGDGNPLIAASAHGHLDVVKRLVAHGANVNAIVEDDETPLINAARGGDLALVRFLVTRGADVNLGVFANNHVWRSPLNQASSKAIKRYLRSEGAVPR
ncbi:M56 family metallopeptidase [Oleiagrimonas sp. C23AA]|uniref:M56 family metallopeptidase n=1 Tax=Oleiagrimonas sp. C23AA TaxID=2719047 RepID=UPI00141E8FB1|nr:M56 family metallopeptidase [Oleiagrimonas sp. C23AA]NII11055.1 hypothetical protein [Oleiagrimonas sp. C23AA]